MSFVNQLRIQLEAHGNQDVSLQMQAYMKDLFPFLGIKAPERKAALKQVINSYKEEAKTKTTEIVKVLYQLEEREFHYCAMEIYARFKKRHYVESDLKLIEYLITTHSHWDSVDFIAKHILGQFLLEFPELRDKTIHSYSESDNMWLNRSALLFQLGYKTKTDFKLLTSLCLAHKDSDEFFIRKAIGWALREYAKIDMPSVETFVKSTNLKPLSEKEALKHLK